MADGSFTLGSSAFQAGGPIPPEYTCDGDGVSPPLEWRGAPPGARSLALIVDDPDAPGPAAPKRVFVHWVLYDLPAADGALARGVRDDALPRGTRIGSNDRNARGYTPPCPPIGQHRYFFRLHALDTELSDLGDASRSRVDDAMQGHVLATAELVGTYARSR
jgi:Raf kinase inhibitor-like YbhB/YbcL family protein